MVFFTPVLFMPGIGAVTWNPATVSAGITLSGGNLIATETATSGENFAYSTTTGTKVYFEIVCTTHSSSGSDGNRVGFGVADSSFTGASFLGSDTHSIAVYDSGSVFYNGSSIGSGTSANWTSGNNIGVAVDIANSLIWFRLNGGNWNTSGTANPATGIGGLSTGSVGSPIKAATDLRTNNSSAPVNTVTAQFASASWTYTAPSGFVHL